jgi:hypothetical protein
MEVHPEGSATGHLDQDFPWFYSVPQQMRQSVYKLHVALRFTCRSRNGDSRTLLQCSLTNLNSKINPIMRTEAPAQLLSSDYKKVRVLTHSLLHFPTLYPNSNVLLPEGHLTSDLEKEMVHLQTLVAKRTALA